MPGDRLLILIGRTLIRGASRKEDRYELVIALGKSRPTMRLVNDFTPRKSARDISNGTWGCVHWSISVCFVCLPDSLACLATSKRYAIDLNAAGNTFNMIVNEKQKKKKEMCAVHMEC